MEVEQWTFANVVQVDILVTPRTSSLHLGAVDVVQVLALVFDPNSTPLLALDLSTVLGLKGKDIGGEGGHIVVSAERANNPNLVADKCGRVSRLLPKAFGSYPKKAGNAQCMSIAATDSRGDGAVSHRTLHFDLMKYDSPLLGLTRVR